MVESKPKKRWESFAKITQRVHKGGWFYPRDLKAELGLPDRTIDHDLKLGVRLGIFKKDEKSSAYSWIDYLSDEKVIRDFFDIWFPVYTNDLTLKNKLWPHSIDFLEFVILYTAMKAGKDPHDPEFRKICFKVAKDFIGNPEKLPPEVLEKICKDIEKMFEIAYQTYNNS